jgi:hypothetical protein
VASESVQGEGSWVEVKEIKYGEYKRARKLAAEGGGEELDEQMIRDHVAAWNWVDDDDNPMPLPSAQPSVIDDLTVLEKGFLITAIFQVEQNPN